MLFDDDKTQLLEESPKSNLLSAGQIFGQYKVIRLLGRGGMGEVYEVEHKVIRKRYALKLVNREIMSRPESLTRFEREAEVMAMLDHPHIVKVDDFGETDGLTWLRMELVGGADRSEGESESESGVHSSLSDLLQGEPLPEELVIDQLRQILGGLAYAHEQGVVHRDLKPSNILLSSESEDLSVNLASLSGKTITPMITDFGLVRLAGEQWLQSQVQLTVARSMADPDATRLDGEDSGSAGTPAQALLGTFEFMSPEQKKGQEATIQSDLYAVGLIAFRMLTGEDMPGMESASQIVDGLNPEWDVWLINALKAKADARFGSAREMLEQMPSGEAAIADEKVESGSERSDKTGSGRAGDRTKVESAEVKGSAGAPALAKPKGEDGSRAAPSSAKSSRKGLWIALVALLLLGGALGYYFGVLVPERETVALEPEFKETRIVETAKPIAQVDARGGMVIKTEPSGAQVSVAGAQTLRSPAVFDDLKVGEQSVRIELDGYDPLSVTVRIDQGDYAQPPVYPLRRSVGDLLVQTEPPGATIIVDGRKIGTSPLVENDLPVGSYRVRAEWGQFFKPAEESIRVERDDKATVTLESGGRDFEVTFGRPIEMKWIGPGEFTMGSPADEPGRDSDERQYQVELSQGYWLGATEITYGQWKELMGTDLRDQVRKALEDDTVYNFGGGVKQTLRERWGLERDADPALRLGPEGEDIPMHYVSWEEVMEFCRKLTERERRAGRLPEVYAYTLPTEAQWEYACRAGTTTATYAGAIEILGKNNAPILDKIAWYGGNSSEGYSGPGWNTDSWEEKQYPGGTAGPRDVGTLEPNAWGLYDMHGNVWEWCSDWYGDYPSGSVVDPTGARSRSLRVYRGGSWFNDARHCRSAYRIRNSPGYRSSTLGFRLALSVNP